MPGVLPPAECHVWWGDPDGPLAGCTELLDTGERVRMRRLALEADRRRYVAAHVLARMVVSRYVDRHPADLRLVARCATCGGPHGKPRLEGHTTALELSLSHSTDRVVVAVAGAGVSVGVDVEKVEDSLDHARLAKDVLAPVEQRAMGRLPPAERGAGFFRYWVRKEAVLKATGDGLLSPPNLLTVSPPDQAAAVVHWERHPSADVAVQLHDLVAGRGYVASVALLSDTPHRVVEREGSSLLPSASAVATPCTADDSTAVHDVVKVRFGPSNLALAIDEHNRRASMEAVLRARCDHPDHQAP